MGPLESCYRLSGYQQSLIAAFRICNSGSASIFRADTLPSNLDSALHKIMAILTTARLAQLAATPLLGSSWYYVAAATFSVCNQPEEVPRIFDYMMDRTEGLEPQFQVAQKMREALLKSAALGGLPKSINSLTQLKNATPEQLREHTLQRNKPLDPNRGASFFDAVYGKVARRILNQMSGAYPDLGAYAINQVYAPLLSFTDILGPKDTSLVVIACLIPQDVNPQLKGHLKGGLNNGATKEEIMSLRDMVMTICQWCGVTWKNEVAKL